MATKDKRIDAYIEKARDFAKPVLTHLRTVIHKASRDIDESIKWGMPYFQYNGKLLCFMASFREHCVFGFKQGAMMTDPKGLMQRSSDKSGMGHFGKIKDMRDLPSEKVLIQYIKEAIKLIDRGVRTPQKKAPATEIEVPEDFMKLLKKNKESHQAFEEFSKSHKKEYIEWITEAKTAETRNKRMNTAIEWIGQGKGRNWKYEKK